MMINCRSLSICSIFVLVFVISCSEVRENCDISPDYDKLMNEIENMGKMDKGLDDIRYAELMALKSRCNF